MAAFRKFREMENRSFCERTINIVIPHKLEDDKKLFFPIFVTIISIAQIFCFVLDEITVPNSTQTGEGMVMKALVFDPNKKLEIWRFLTYMFVHNGGYLHLVNNLACQILFGMTLEMRYGWKLVLPVNIMGVIFGSLASAAYYPHIQMTGASAGGWALIFAFINVISMNWEEMKPSRPFYYWGVFDFFCIFVLTYFLFYEIGNEMYYRFTNSLDQSTSYLAHVAGALYAGFCVPIIIFENPKESPRLVIILLGIQVFCIIIVIFKVIKQ